jgi:Lrp/AsnC family transcriptional regulator for asnA, asnC and gidA
MSEYCEIDNIDRKILRELREDSRVSFQEIARKLGVSGGTIHLRVNKLRKSGVIKGSRLLLDPGLLGFDICVFIGLNLHKAGDHIRVVEKLKKMPEVVEAHFTTGTYSLFIKVYVTSTEGLHKFLVEKLQSIKEIQSTETLVSLDMPIDRALDIQNK